MKTFSRYHRSTVVGHFGDIANPDRQDPVVWRTISGPSRYNKTGILAFLFSEVGFFGVLILAYLYFYAHPHPGPGPKELDVPRTLVFSVCLFASSFTFWRSEVALHKHVADRCLAGLP